MTDHEQGSEDAPKSTDDSPNYAELFKDSDGQWRFRLKSGANHKTIAQSEGYNRRKDAVDTLSRYFGGYEF